MTDDQAMREQWETLLAAHRELVSAYLKALGTQDAPLVAMQVRAITIQACALSRLLNLPLEDEHR